MNPQTNTLSSAPLTRPAPVLVNFNQVTAREVAWLWPQRIPLGAVTLLIGDPGLGKSLVTIDLAARLSCGRSWPDDEPCHSGSALLMNAEDSEENTICPRLKAAGADLSKVFALRSVQDPAAAEGDRAFSLATDMAVLEEAIKSRPDCRLVVIDPITAYLRGGDAQDNGQVRTILASLTELARRYHVAVLAVSHLNKRDGGQVTYRALGAMAFVAASRSVQLIVKDPKADRILLMPVKTNLSASPLGLPFRVQSKPIEAAGAEQVPAACAGAGRSESETDGTHDAGVPIVCWENDVVEQSVEELLAGSVRFYLSDKRQQEQQTYADEWLRERLAHGSELSTDVAYDAGQAGISPWQLFNASRSVGVVKKKIGFLSSWTWELAENMDPSQLKEMLEQGPTDEEEEEGEYEHDEEDAQERGKLRPGARGKRARGKRVRAKRVRGGRRR